MRFKPNQEVVCTSNNWCSIESSPISLRVPPSHPIEDNLYTVRAQSPGLSNFIELQEFPGNYWDQDEFEPVVSDEVIKELLEHQLTEA